MHRHGVVEQLLRAETCFLQRTGTVRMLRAEVEMAKVGPVELPLVVIRFEESAAVLLRRPLVATGQSDEALGTIVTVVALALAVAQLEAQVGVLAACLR